MKNVVLYNIFHNRSKRYIRLIDHKNFTYRLMLPYIDNIIGNKRLKILDYGCGVGTLSFYLASNGNKVTGVDISDTAIEIAKTSGNQSKDLNKLNVDFFELSSFVHSKNTYDFVLCSEVIEHISGDTKILKIIYSMLKSKGMALISVPSLNAPLYRLGILKEFDKKVGHKRRYSFETIVKKLKSADFEIISMYKQEGILRNALFTIPIFGWIVRFLRGPFSDIVTFLDTVLLNLFGESDLVVIVQKK